MLKEARVEVLFKALLVINGGWVPHNRVGEFHCEVVEGPEADRVAVRQVHLDDLLDIKLNTLKGRFHCEINH